MSFLFMLTLYSWKENKKERAITLSFRRWRFVIHHIWDIYVYYLRTLYCTIISILSWSFFMAKTFQVNTIALKSYISQAKKSSFFLLWLYQDLFKKKHIMIILDPYRKFNIFVKAYNTKNEGNASQDIQVHTF